jgi:magnesium-protoporphyrin IX monomethyl ester (oxidative) cyclase
VGEGAEGAATGQCGPREAKKSGNLFKRIGASARAAVAFVGLYTIPAKQNRVPVNTRLEPAY